MALQTIPNQQQTNLPLFEFYAVSWILFESHVEDLQIIILRPTREYLPYGKTSCAVTMIEMLSWRWAQIISTCTSNGRNCKIRVDKQARPPFCYTNPRAVILNINHWRDCSAYGIVGLVYLYHVFCRQVLPRMAKQSLLQLAANSCSTRRLRRIDPASAGFFHFAMVLLLKEKD